LREVHAVLIAGPTASGKSNCAIELARESNGVVINADSMQVYRDLPILSARPTPEETAQAPHLLFGHVGAERNYSVGQWLEDARLALDEVRARVRAEYAGVAPELLHARLSELDPQTAARLRPSDPQRLLRALEIFATTGAPLAAFQGAREKPLLDAQKCQCRFIAPDRTELRRRIDARFDAMMAAGAVEEVRRLMARQLDPALPAMRAVGVPGLLDFLQGECALEAAVERGKRDSRQYARRQFTFARTQLPEFSWVAPDF
jgi:tRNA dimethylallyltransferase